MTSNNPNPENPTPGDPGPMPPAQVSAQLTIKKVVEKITVVNEDLSVQRIGEITLSFTDIDEGTIRRFQRAALYEHPVKAIFQFLQWELRQLPDIPMDDMNWRIPE